jgi:dihydropyrimidine dehydrogenase (NAD+) subunit PreA
MSGVDLSVDFCGLKSMNPFWLSSSPVANSYEMVARAFDAGWAGCAYKTLGLDGPAGPIVNVTPRLGILDYEDKRFIGLENIELITDRPLKDNLKDITRLKKEYPSHILFVSIMAEVKKEAWQELARMAEDAGCDGLELNFSCPHGMPEKGMGAAIGQDPRITKRITGWVKEVARTPVMVKMTPNITDMRIPARAAKAAGADALAAINTVQTLLGVDLESLTPIPTVSGKGAYGGYSGPAVKPIALRFISEIANDPELGLPISGMGGLSTWQDAAEFLLVGATTLQVTTAIMRYGYRIIDDLREGLANYMKEKGFAKVSDMIGLSLSKISRHEDLARTPKLVASINRDLCIKDDICYIVCQDAGHQAITLDKDRLPKVDKDECGGCSLCMHVCPVEGCITMKKKTK